MKKIILYVTFIQTLLNVACINASNDTSAKDNVTDQGSNAIPEEDIYANKDESLQTCFGFNISSEAYMIFPNRTVYIPIYNKTYEEPFYILDGEFLIICAPPEIFEEEEPVSNLVSTSLRYISVVGTGVSLVFFLVHLVVFALVPDLHNLPGFNLASLCLSLFISYLILFLSDVGALDETGNACVVKASSVQFFFLASFVWMFVMAFDVFRSILSATESFRAAVKGFKVKKYILNSCICWGTSLVFTAAALIADNVEGIDDTYKPYFRENTCWFKSKQALLAFFAGPVFTLICLNVLLFAISAYIIFANRMKVGEENSKRAYLKKNYHTYLRLAVIMGVTWITGVLAPLVNVLWLWYLFAILNTFQGFFIFIAFTCTGKVKKYFRMNLENVRRASQQTLTTPTFQSYCNYANSIEKDLDKVVDNKEKSGQIDTIVIHL
ncbi:g-protein coupled receptor Mth2 [Caerostris darwini]|uniref:G-protein coupled receptor Mth2 n=1 Tax=Caerostris darwini TaxID=1538125 RepID=A0AAV4MRX5_9ARAC|nr:g-protein coupled receptor Mth2 [Caerostris darwini]